MIKTYATYELLMSETPTVMDPNGALESGLYLAAIRKLPARKVMADVLNVRNGPSILADEIAEVHAGDQVTVYETKGEWCRISQSIQAWVSVRYLGL